MNASMYTLLILALMFANAPFLTQRAFGLFKLRRKHMAWHLLELAIGWLLVGGIAYVLENRAGMVHRQGWEFYVVALCLYLVLAFPAFVWRYFWQGKYEQ